MKEIVLRIIRFIAGTLIFGIAVYGWRFYGFDGIIAVILGFVGISVVLSALNVNLTDAED